MSDLRHAVTDDDGMGQPAEVLTLARDYAPGHAIPAHRHSRDQLVYASHGVMTVQTRAGIWVTPADRATFLWGGCSWRRPLFLRSERPWS